MEDQIFITGTQPDPGGPLSRYLPPVPGGVFAAWLADHVPPGSWVLDPFGSAPRTAVEAARAGYRVVVASNNPIDRFLIDLAANPPTESELRSSLADLGAALKGDQRVEPHLRGLYTTSCNHCKNLISAEAFIWDRGAALPHSRVYTCPNCGDTGEFPITSGDDASLSQLPSSQLHRARALERVAPRDDPDRIFVEEALDVYTPRSLYALFTLVNKLDSLPALQRRSIYALLLAAFDQANILWAHPYQRSRPRQLMIPSHYRENNVWLALEGAIGAWTTAYPAQEIHLPVTTWPQKPPESGGICIFEGRLKELADTWVEASESEKQPDKLQFQAVVAVLPRPNQAYWTLSALWSGWLWGREAAADFKIVLRRRRYDWNWHLSALFAAFTHLSQLISEQTPIFGLIAESETGFVSAALLAAGKAGFLLNGLAFRQATDQAQIAWQRVNLTNKSPSENPELTTEPFQMIYQKSGLEYLSRRGEPASYIELHTAALAGLAASRTYINWPLVHDEPLGGTEHPKETSPAEFFLRLNNDLQGAFSYRAGFVRFHGSQKTLETGQWWLRESALSTLDSSEEELISKITIPSAELAPPLADRVEMEFVRLLVKSGSLSSDQIDQAMLQAFAGLLTPDQNLILECCGSYAEPTPGEADRWRLREQEYPRLRRADLEAITELLIALGRRLNYTTDQPISDSRWITWKDQSNRLIYAFYPSVTAILGHIFLQKFFPPQNCILVYPGGRAGLIRYKLRQDARLQAFAEQGWRFVKFRHTRFLAESELLTQANLDEQLFLDPMAKQDPQMTFL